MTSDSENGPDDVADHLVRMRPDLGWLAEDIRDAQPLNVGEPLRVHQRVRIYGGYDEDPGWLARRPDGCTGTVIAFIPGQNELPAVLIELDQELRAAEVVGGYVVLEQGWVGVPWGQTSPRVHVELCDFHPEARPWPERRQGTWIESHATFETIDS